MAYLELRNIKYNKNGKDIIDCVSLNFNKGKVYAVVGPNGAGKTSLAHLIMGLEEYREHKGDILLNGEKINSLKVKQRADLGITLGWQDPAKFEGLTVKQYLQASSGYKSQKVIEEVLADVGLNPEEYLDRIVDGNLSGGERKRVELASIMSMNPKVVILDEPDSGIDIGSLDLILNAIDNMRNKGITVIIITHSSYIIDIADSAYLMCHGNIVDEGSVEKIKKYFEGKCLGCSVKDPERIKK